MNYGVKTTTITTASNQDLALSVFKPKQSNHKSIVISSATGVLQKYYFRFANHFAQLGFTVYTFDYYGIGASNSKNIKQITANLNTWAMDQAAVLKYAKEKNPEHKLVLITHSIGGQLIGLNPEIKLVDAIITVASQTGYWKYFQGFSKFRMCMFWYVLIPVFTPLFGYFPAKQLGLFENIPKQVAYQWREWGIHPEYMFGHFKHTSLYFNSIRCNVLALSFPRDIFASKASVDWLASKFTQAEVDRRHLIPEELQIKDIQHFGFFKKAFKESLWSLTETWIEENT
ncbi:alpha/beta hydrolase [Xanthomarina sp. F1114]|uniref:alpha/beta hydrolase family protein n=1 Tax=Xanthomarina sp. F1114 TaxID=2996019 RepID=UPI00225E1E54|nr:alpha/beta fold hydrolase [Xanthomarina sp. F1114]MCX7548668.1 alpha/beta hydrolase [Xanthomarina sp. F1114]